MVKCDFVKIFKIKLRRDLIKNSIVMDKAHLQYTYNDTFQSHKISLNKMKGTVSTQ